MNDKEMKPWPKLSLQKLAERDRPAISPPADFIPALE